MALLRSTPGVPQILVPQHDQAVKIVPCCCEWSDQPPSDLVSTAFVLGSRGLLCLLGYIDNAALTLFVLGRGCK